MPLVMQGRTTTSLVTGSIIEFIPPANKPLLIKKITFCMTNAAATGTLGFGIPAAKGVTPTSPQLMRLVNGGGDAASSSAMAWGTPPTAPTLYVGVVQLGIAIGAVQSIDFPGNGFLVPVNSTFVIFAFSTVHPYCVTIVAQE